jgi:CRISPR-associated endonuclease/helicase Cas3
MNYLSHSTQKLIDHIENIKLYDKEDTLFCRCVAFHDLGKVTNNFQTYIQDTANHTSEPHAPVSAIIYLLNHIKRDLIIAKDDLFVFNAILSHHGKLKSFKNEKGKDILEFFRVDLPQHQINEIYNKDDVVSYLKLQTIETTNFKKLQRRNRDLTFFIEDFITQKLLFSKLIFADKYEAIYNREHKKVVNGNSVMQLHEVLKKVINKKDSKRDRVKNNILNCYDKNYTIFTLTAPTGIGKTLTSLELALKIKEDKNLSKIIYILPFTSIIDQTYEIFDKLFPNDIIKHHYAVTFDENCDNQDEKNSYDRWKFILNSWNEPFILSTLYQLFFAIFSNKNSDNIKFQALQNSVIVLDEVQAIPFELWKAFKEILPILSQQLNSTFILMSATMPILTQKGVALELANKAEIFEEKNRYVLKCLEGNALENLANVIIELYQEEKSVLCVVNSIKTSKLLYKIVKESVEHSYCLNSYMFFDDRKEVIKTIKDNEKSSNVSNKILISTQVIEAGVDLDFDVGLREFAPISSIIQTAGRVNREGKKGISEIYIFDTITKIYDAMMISESRKILFEALENQDIYEKDILIYVEKYFQALDENKGDSGILEDISRFDFDTISKKNRDAFGLEQDYIKSVALGVNLKEYEYRYFDNIKGLKPYEIKREKEKIIKEFQPKILNIKEKDLNALGFEIPFSDIFGIYYIQEIDDIYTKERGFRLREEKDEDDLFN